MIPQTIIHCFKNKFTFCYKPPVLPNKTTLCFIPGFHSDFISSKKSNLVYNYAIKNNYGFLSWNYTDHGSVVDWYKDGIELVKEYKSDKFYYIGASMGLWISLLMATHGHTPNGILSIGGGIDFTERWLTTEVPLKERDNVEYIWKRPSEYDSRGYYEIPISFLIDSRPALIMSKKQKEAPMINIDCPIYLVHGSLDKDVPIKIARDVYHYLSSSLLLNVTFDEIVCGDHQLSRSQDLDLILAKIKLIVE